MEYEITAAQIAFFILNTSTSLSPPSIKQQFKSDRFSFETLVSQCPLTKAISTITGVD
jgi:hypothetical protein